MCVHCEVCACVCIVRCVHVCGQRVLVFHFVPPLVLPHAAERASHRLQILEQLR